MSCHYRDGVCLFVGLSPKGETPDLIRGSLTDGNSHALTYTYDGFDRLSKITYPNTKFESFSYDNNGNVLVKTARSGNTITNTYDALNRLVTKAPQGELTATYTYDLAGRMLSAGDTNGTWPYAYDTAGRVASVTTTGGGVIGYLYDANTSVEPAGRSPRT